MSTKQIVSRVVATALVAGIFVAGGWALVHRQYVADAVSAWQYEPSNDIATIADRAQLSETGRFYFYASHPTISDATTFNQQCQRVENKSAILGCYSSGRIYIYNVDNPELDGIQEVTAAHEMLHAAWDRLGEKEREELGVLLEAEYETLDSESLRERMAYYERAQPGERLNELHSIIATEVHDIDEQLEQHYRTYLRDRSSVLALHDKYESVFLDVQQRAEALSSEIESLVVSLDERITVYNAAIQALNQDIATFNQRASTGEYSSASAFNTDRAVLLGRSQALQTELSAIQSDTQRYDELRQELEQISSESEALQRSIDSTVDEAPTLQV